MPRKITDVGYPEKDATTGNMNILIAGDSWGCGEWDVNCDYNPHTGLQKFLEDDGYKVYNVSHQGLGNHEIYQNTKAFLDRSFIDQIDLVIIFQSEYNRDYKFSGTWQDYLSAEDWKNTNEANDAAHRWLSRFYRNLSDLSIQMQIPIKIIGGHADTIWIDDFDSLYPGCQIACQSMTNLILKGEHRIENPIFSFYEKKTEELVKKLKSILGPDQIADLLDLITQGMQREMLLRSNPKYFFPDGIHPNRLGYQILYHFIKNKL